MSLVETRREEVVEREEPGGEKHEDVVEEHREDVVAADDGTTKDELLRRAADLNISGRSSMTKAELARAIFDAESSAALVTVSKVDLQVGDRLVARRGY